jgi:hypothetical protein
MSDISLTSRLQSTATLSIFCFPPQNSTFAVNAVPFLDAVVSEYLHWRGLTSSAHTFDSERYQSNVLDEHASTAPSSAGSQVNDGLGGSSSAVESPVVTSESGSADRVRAFRVNRIVDAILALVTQSDLGFEREWQHLCAMFLSRLRDPDAHRSIRALTLSLRRYFLVCAIQHGRTAAVSEFFAALSSELRHDREWQAWFQLPFVEDPAADPTFAVYFSRLWAENLVQSLHNLLCSVFQALPMPKLLQFNTERLRRQKLESQVEFLQSDVQRLTQRLTSLTVANARLMEGGPSARGDSSPSFGLDDSKSTQLSEIVSVNGAAATTRRRSTIEATPLRAGHQRERSALANLPAVSAADEAKGPLSAVPQRVLKGHTSALTTCRLSSDGSLIASAAYDGTVRLWRGSDHCSEVRLADGDALSLAFGRGVVYAGTNTGSIALIDPTGARGLLSTMSIGKEACVTRLMALSGSSSLAALCSSPFGTNSASLKVFDAEAGLLTEMVQVSDAQQSPLSFAYSASGSVLAVGASDGSLTLSATKSRSSEKTHWHAQKAPILGVAFASENVLVTLAADGVLAAFDRRLPGRPWAMSQEARHCGWWQRSAQDVVCTSGFVIAGGGRQNCALVFDFRDASAAPAAHVMRLNEHEAGVSGVDLAASTLATSSVDSTVQVVKLAIHGNSDAAQQDE